MKEGPQWFSDMFLYELLLPHKKIRMFGPKTAIFAPKHAFISTYMYLAGVFGALSVGRLVGCGVSRKTPIYFMIFVPKTAKFGPKYAFLVILGQILAFLVPCPTK